MGRYSKAFSIKKQFQSPNCQTCQGQSRTLKKIVFLELFLRITEVEKWNLFEKLGQLRTPSDHHIMSYTPRTERREGSLRALIFQPHPTWAAIRTINNQGQAEELLGAGPWTKYNNWWSLTCIRQHQILGAAWEPSPAPSRESDHEREQMKDALLLGKKWPRKLLLMARHQ